MLRHFLYLLFLLPITSNAEYKDWSETDQRWFIASNIAMGLDWATTRKISEKNWPNGIYETNLILGKKPTKGQLDLYFITNIIANYYITDYISPSRRGNYLKVRTIAHGAAGISNYNLMLSVGLRW